MSIIYEALNKLQKKEQSLPLVKTQTAKKSQKFNKLFLALILLLLIITAFIKYNQSLFTKLYQRASKSKQIPIPLVKIELGDKNDYRSETKEDIRIEQQFYLSGIFASDTEPLAIINDTIVETGNIISEAKVVKINDNSVELEYQGQKIILTLQ